jgi:hypothetical protein
MLHASRAASILLALLFVLIPASGTSAQESGNRSPSESAGEEAIQEGAAVAGAGPVTDPPLDRSSTVLTPGIFATWGGGTSSELGIGVQLRLQHYPTRYSLRFGALVQAEVQSDGTVRLLGGLANGLWLFGCELGLAYRADSGRYASSLGLHLGKSIDLGPVSFGGRMTIPLADFQPQNGPSRPVQGFEAAIVLTFQLPATLDGPDRHPFDCGRRQRRP